jgi:hypothetical protein
LVSEKVRQTVFSFIPAGPIFETFWSYRSNLKQKRVIEFSESVKTALEEIGGKEIHASNLQTEDFVDLMELVYLKVISTSSVYKLERFRDILVNKIVEPEKENHLFKKYVNLLDQLEDVQILILDDFKYWKGNPIRSVIIAYEGEIGAALPDDAIIERISKKAGTNVTKSEVEYYTNELVTLGLVRNSARVITAMGENSPQNNFQISPVGLLFLEFIEMNT